MSGVLSWISCFSLKSAEADRFLLSEPSEWSVICSFGRSRAALEESEF